MSQMTIATRLGRAVPHVRLPRAGEVRIGGGATRTRVVDAAPAAGHTGFRLLCLAVVLATCAAVLLLNTARAEGSYTLSRLAAEQTTLHDKRVTLEAELSDLRSSETLAENARQLHMVPSTSTATLRLSDGSITGVASKVDGGRTITVDLPATGVAVDDD
ncbi:MAG: hypothetical protein DCC50_12345 [Acidobacteria bacterium]|nr:MAG: hypothetical protein DCC50_12345 [Acidobacteriota bacterium]